MKNYLENVDREAAPRPCRADAPLRRRGARHREPLDQSCRGQGARLLDFGFRCVRDLPALARSVARHLLFQVLQKLRTLFFVAFAASWLYMLWRIFFDEEE